MSAEIVSSASDLQWNYANCSLPEPRHDCEMSMATVVRFNRLSGDGEWKPREVWFRHPKPKDVSEHRKLLENLGAVWGAT